MARRGKRWNQGLQAFDRTTLYAPEEALEAVLKTSTAKFDETIEAHLRLGIDPKRSDQTVRGTVVLPHGTGKTPRVIVFAKADKAKDAEEAGADEVGADELIARVKGGWSNFDVAVAAPDMMGQLGKELGKVLGARMPNPKAGTVTPDIKKAIKELKSGKIQYRTDKLGIIHSPIGKKSFDKEKLLQNLATLLDAVIRAKPSTAKGAYLRSVIICSTMGPGVKVDAQKAVLLAQGRL